MNRPFAFPVLNILYNSCSFSYSFKVIKCCVQLHYCCIHSYQHIKSVVAGLNTKRGKYRGLKNIINAPVFSWSFLEVRGGGDAIILYFPWLPTISSGDFFSKLIYIHVFLCGKLYFHTYVILSCLFSGYLSNVTGCVSNEAYVYCCCLCLQHVYWMFFYYSVLYNSLVASFCIHIFHLVLLLYFFNFFENLSVQCC